jgi:CSLREA domain-containing protein
MVLLCHFEDRRSTFVTKGNAMKSFLSCWNKTLAQLGFRRKVRKSRSKWHYGRRQLFENLESRQMLSITVNTLEDQNDGSGVNGWSLRDALIAASNGETIEFDPSLAGGTIELTNGALNVNRDVTIEGSGADQLTIDAQGATNVFYVFQNSSETPNVAIKGLTLTGASGVGVRAAQPATLNLQGVEIVGNSGGGVEAYQGFAMTDSLVAENTGGPAIYLRYGTFSITNTTVSNNTSPTKSAGIVTGYGTLTLKNVTVTENTADINNIYTGQASGGLYTESYTGIIAYNTIATGNRAMEGGVPVAADVYESTPSSGNIYGNYNLIGEHFGGFTGSNNIFSTNPAAVKLAPLGDYGGSTRTHALLPGSLALNAGNDTYAVGITNDQRGYDRTVGTVDIGAFESQKSLFEVDTLVDENDGDYGPGDRSLREAINLAGLTAGNDTITFAPGLGNALELQSALLLGSSSQPIQGNITIEGPGADLLALDANGASRVIDFTYNPNYYNLTVRGLGLTGASGVALQREGGDNVDVILDEVKVFGNGAGVAFAYGGNLTLTKTEIADNAGIGVSFAYASSLTMTGSTVAENRGGGVTIGYATAAITNSTISSNESSGPVPGLSLAFGSTTLTNVTIADNRADANNSSGASTATGGISVSSYATLTMHNTIVARNWAGADDGSALPSDIKRASNATIAAASSHNLIGYDPDLANGLNNDPTVKHNMVGGESGAPAVDPRLSLLADFGGPSRTHALLNESPALDAGSDNFGGDFDQRLHARPFDAQGTVNTSSFTTDIGAFEAGNPTTLVVRVVEDEDEVEAADSQDLSLREALKLAGELAEVERIEFDPAVFSVPRESMLTYGPLSIANGITIIGPGAGLLTINANGNATAFTLETAYEFIEPEDEYPISISGLRLTNSSTAAIRGELTPLKSLDLTDVVIEGNQGKGIHLEDLIGGPSVITISNSVIAQNQGTAVKAKSYMALSVIDSVVDSNL